jgi:hypothetical protein
MNAVEIGLYNALKANSTLTAALSATTAIYNTMAPQGTSMAYVVFNWAGGGLENINPSDLHNIVYNVRAVADDTAEASTIQGYIKSALHKATLTVSGYTNFYTACEDEIQYAEETSDGQVIHHRGYAVRIRIDD